MRNTPLNPKNCFILAALILVPVLGAWAQPGTGAPPQETPLPEGAAAVVNGEVITLKEVHEALFRQYGQNLLGQMVKAKLAKQEAKRLNIAVDAKEVQKKVDEWKKNFLGRFNNDEKAADEMLKRQGTTLANTLAYMRDYHSNENLWAQLVRAKKKPDYDSLKQTFEQKYGQDGEMFKVAHIVFTTNLNDERFASRYSEKEHYLQIDRIEKEAKDTADKLAARVRGGEDFGMLAGKFSDDWSKSGGGKLGEFWKNRFGKEFEAAVEAGTIGDILGPFKVKEGCVAAKIEPAEFDTAYSARHIFLAFTDKDRDKVLTQVKTLKAQLTQGADFAALAKTHSQDPLTRDKGGLWDSFKSGEKVPQISSALERLEPGGVSDPIPTPFGVHLVQLVKKVTTPKGTKKAVSIILISTQYPQVREKTLKSVLEKEIRGKAMKVIQDLKAGGDFTKLAREYSDEKFTGERGGIINGYSSQRISPEFHEVVKALKPGEVASEPVSSPHGFHVVKLIQREKTSFEKVKDELFKEDRDRQPSPVEIQKLQEQLTNMAKIVQRK